MKTLKTTSLAVAVLLALTGSAVAQGHLAGRPEPKALNPQPEVPSKPKAHASLEEFRGRTDPKALNPQPEVPSKPKAKKKPPKTAQR